MKNYVLDKDGDIWARHEDKYYLILDLFTGYMSGISLSELDKRHGPLFSVERGPKIANVDAFVKGDCALIDVRNCNGMIGEVVSYNPENHSYVLLVERDAGDVNYDVS